MVEVRSTTVFKCVATPGVKWCHVLKRGEFEAKTSPNLVTRVVRWCNVWPHLGRISDPWEDLDRLQLSLSHILGFVIAVEPDHVPLDKCRPCLPG